MESRFQDELARWGPGSRPASATEARAYCRRLALSHYENFSVVSLFVPRPLLRHFCHVYAYCRWADDLADETAGGQRSLDLLSWWRSELLACYGGMPRHPVHLALRETIERFTIPPEPFLDLLTAFEQDQRVKTYDSIEQLLGYCRNSANPVGRLVLYLGRCHDDERGELSDQICTGLQLANFWQDVARDYAIGRMYLPREDCERFGVDERELAEGRCTASFQALMHFQVDRARGFFLRGRPLIALIPRNLQSQVELFAHGGLAILDKIERQRYDVLSHRPTLSKWDKMLLMARAVARRWGTGAVA